MTLQDVISKWTLIADRQTFNTIKEDITLFINEAKTAGTLFVELARRKEQIISIWSPVSWKKAQEEFTHWNKRNWYETRHQWIINHFGKSLTEIYAAEIQAMKTPAVAAPSAFTATPAPSKPSNAPASSYLRPTATEDDYYSQFEVFTTHQQVLDHTKEYQEKLRKKELAQ